MSFLAGGMRGQNTHKTLELELHRKARDSHGRGVRVLPLEISLGSGEVNKSSVARKHVGNELVVLVFVRSARVPRLGIFGASGQHTQKIRIRRL